MKRAVERFLEAAVLVLMAALAVVVVLGVGFRKFGESLVWYDEVASVLLAWLTYYGAALAALRRAHIGVPTLLEWLPPRVRIPLVWLSEALVIGFFAVVAWAGWRVIRILAGESLISLPWVPTQLTQSVIPIGAVLFIVARVLSFPGILERARHAHPPRGDGAGSGTGVGPETPEPA